MNNKETELKSSISKREIFDDVWDLGYREDQPNSIKTVTMNDNDNDNDNWDSVLNIYEPTRKENKPLEKKVNPVINKNIPIKKLKTKNFKPKLNTGSSKISDDEYDQYDQYD